MENLNLNYMVICRNVIAPMFGTVSLDKITDIDRLDLPGGIKDHRALLAFGVAVLDGESNYILDFKVILPDGKTDAVDRAAVGKLGNKLILRGQFDVISKFSQKGIYVFQAYHEERLLGQYVFEAR
ncbi:MAG TPA: hypothetical protein VGD05_06225 [Pyrinomonadaceae bacterium]|jgi:hypothetical protein